MKRMRVLSMALVLVSYAFVAQAAEREKVALMPLQSGLGTPTGLGDAWSPLLAELLYERNKTPLYPPAMKLSPTVRNLVAQCTNTTCYQDVGAALGARKLVAGGITREGLRYFLTLTLHDLSTFKQVARAERTWAGAAGLDRELSAALDELLGAPPPPVAVAAAEKTEKKPEAIVAQPTQPKSAPPPIGTEASVTQSLQPQSDYIYRSPAVTLTIVGSLGIAAGLGMLIANRVVLGGFQAQVADYNKSIVRTQAQYDRLRATEQTLGGLQIGTSAAIGIGAAALTAGIVLFAIDGKPKRIAFVPSGAGGAIVGAF
jgi:hypothetical protein